MELYDSYPEATGTEVDVLDAAVTSNLRLLTHRSVAPSRNAGAISLLVSTPSCDTRTTLGVLESFGATYLR